MNEFDLFFDTFSDVLKQFIESRYFFLFAIPAVMLLTSSLIRFILRGFDSPYGNKTPYHGKALKEEKQVFSEDDIS